MRIRTKTRKRLTILFAITVAVGAIGAGAYVWRVNQLKQRVEENRTQGLAYLEQGDVYHAMHYIGRYLKRETDDAELLFTYAKLRLQVREGRNEHYTQAASVLRRVVELQPDHLEATHLLLETYLKIGMSTEAVDTADRLLAKRADDPVALRVKATALFRLRKFDEALVAADRLLAIEPLNFDVQMIRFAVLQSGEDAGKTITADARALLEKHPDDPRARMLLAMALQFTEQRDAAVEMAQRAVEPTPPSGAFAIRAARFLDQISMTVEANAYLEQHADLVLADADLQTQYVDRLWQYGNTDRIIEYGRGLDPESHVVDGDILGLYIAALLRTGERDEAVAAIDQLRLRDWDPASLAWTGVLDCLTAPPSEKQSAALVAACRQALSYQPRQLVFHFFLAEAYHRMGETELALDEWRQTAQGAPAWIEPQLRMGQVLLESNRPAQAFELAQQVLSVAPRSTAAAILLADAWAATAQSQDLLTGSTLLDLIRMVQKAMPGEPRTLLVRAAVFAQQGNPEEARRNLRQMLEANPDIDQALLMRGASLSNRYELNMAAELLQRERDLRGPSAALALARAMQTYQAAGPDKAVAEFDAAADLSLIEWRIARARLLEEVGSPQALGAWTTLADEHPDNVRLQQMVIRSQIAWDDAALIDRTIDRLKEHTGDEGVRWRLARARRLLADDGDNSDAVEASRLLAGVKRHSAGLVECHMLLAEAYRRLDNQAGAIEELTTAVNLQPHAVGPRLLLARMLQQHGRADEAVRTVDQVLNNGAATQDQRRSAITILAAAGRDDRALTLLRAMHDGNPLPPQLLAARIYRNRGQLDEAETIARSLLGEGDAEVIRFMAELLTQRDRNDEAMRVLARLDQTTLSRAERMLIRADFLARRGEIDEAIDAMRDAAAASPDNADAWLALTRLLLVARRADEVDATLQAAARTQASHPAMDLLQANRALIVSLCDHDAARGLVQALFAGAQQREPAMEALKLLRTSLDGKQRVAEAVVAFRKLADRNPQLLPLQNLVAQMYLQSGQFDDAIIIASRAMQAHPQDLDSAAITARALAQTRRWSEALATARDWRLRAKDQSPEADRLIAACLLELGNPEAALRELTDAAGTFDAADKAALPAYTRALVDAGKVDAAWAVLAPMLDASDRARALAMELASRRIADGSKAAAWLNNLESRGGVDRVALGRAWRDLGVRMDEPAHQHRALANLKSVIDAGAPTAEAAVVYGMMCSELKDNAEAQRGYRMALKVDPTHLVATNNLALLLIENKATAAEALELAKANAKRQPALATLQDTLGVIAVKCGAHDVAVAAMRRAVEIAPGEPAWKVNLAWALARSGATEEAWKTLRTVSPQALTELSRTPSYAKNVEELLELTAQTSGGKQSRLQ